MRQWTMVMLMLVITALALPALAQQATPLVYDTPVSGEINDAAPEQRYTFMGNAGDVVTIRMQATGGGLDSYLRLLDPAGSEVFYDDDSGGNLNAVIGPYRLPVAGEYTVVATSCCGYPSPNPTMGSYTLTITRALPPAIAPGSDTPFELTAETPSAIFIIDTAALPTGAYALRLAAANDGADVSIDVRSGLSYITGGYTQDGRSAVIEPLILNAGGLYIVTLRTQPEIAPATSGTLSLTALDTQPYTVGDSISGTLNSDNPSDIYSFEASPAQLLRITGSSAADSQPIEAQLIDPNGMSVNYVDTAFSQTPGSFDYDPLQIRESGTYYLLARRIFVDGVVNDAAVSEYSITIGASAVQRLQSGVPVSGTVGGDVYTVTYAFEASAGQTMTIDIESASDSYGPNVNVEYGGSFNQQTGTPMIVNISGATPGKSVYTATLPSDGIYIVRVANGQSTAEGVPQGNYSLTVTLQ